MPKPAFSENTNVSHIYDPTETYVDGSLVHANFAGIGWDTWEYKASGDLSTANLGTIVDPSAPLTLADQGAGTGTGPLFYRVYYGSVQVKWFHIGTDADDHGPATTAALSISRRVELNSADEDATVIFDTPFSISSDRTTLDFTGARVNARHDGALFSFSGFLRYLIFKANGLQLSRTAGRIFEISPGDSLVEAKIDVQQFTRAAAALNASFYLGVGGDCYGCVFDISRAQVATEDLIHAPLIKHTTSSNSSLFRGNTLKGKFWYGSSGDPIVVLEHTSSTASYNSANEIIIDVAEAAAGGIVKLEGNINTIIKIDKFDLPSALRNAIDLTSSPGNRINIGTEIRYNRQAGDISNFADIFVGDAEDTIINIGGHNSGESEAIVDLNNQVAFCWDRQFVEFLNAENIRYIPSRAGISVNAGERLIIAADEITITDTQAPLLFHRVDTEASASTDDLSIINGGVSGQTLVIQLQTRVRDVTVKHSANIHLNGGVDFLLGEVESKLTPVSYTHLTLPTIYSV